MKENLAYHTIGMIDYYFHRICCSRSRSPSHTSRTFQAHRHLHRGMNLHEGTWRKHIVMGPYFLRFSTNNRVALIDPLQLSIAKNLSSQSRSSILQEDFSLF
jgi:hypothetical protein